MATGTRGVAPLSGSVAVDSRTVELDSPFWANMQEVAYAAHVLDTRHQTLMRHAWLIVREGSREAKAELAVARDTGGEPWLNLHRANQARPKGVRPPIGAPDMLNGGHLLVVPVETVKAYSRVKNGLSTLAATMMASAIRNRIANPDNTLPGIGGTISYSGPNLGPALRGAFMALAGWDRCIELLQQRAMGKKPLAASGPAVPSQQPKPPGMLPAG